MNITIIIMITTHSRGLPSGWVLRRSLYDMLCCSCLIRRSCFCPDGTPCVVLWKPEALIAGRLSLQSLGIYLPVATPSQQQAHHGSTTAEAPPQQHHLGSTIAAEPPRQHHRGSTTAAAPQQSHHCGTPPQQHHNGSTTAAAPPRQHHRGNTIAAVPPRQYHRGSTTAAVPPRQHHHNTDATTTTTAT